MNKSTFRFLYKKCSLSNGQGQVPTTIFYHLGAVRLVCPRLLSACLGLFSLTQHYSFYQPNTIYSTSRTAPIWTGTQMHTTFFKKKMHIPRSKCYGWCSFFLKKMVYVSPQLLSWGGGEREKKISLADVSRTVDKTHALIVRAAATASSSSIRCLLLLNHAFH